MGIFINKTYLPQSITVKVPEYHPVIVLQIIRYQYVRHAVLINVERPTRLLQQQKSTQILAINDLVFDILKLPCIAGNNRAPTSISLV